MMRDEAPKARSAAVASREEREDFFELLRVISRMLIDDPNFEKGVDRNEDERRE